MKDRTLNEAKDYKHQRILAHKKEGVVAKSLRLPVLVIIDV